MNYSSKSLAVKYRPKTFREIVSQNTITDILENQIKTKTFRNTVLFTGPAGTGKTTTARAFASLLNNGKGRPIEIDAASNNSVDDVRNIIVKAQQKAIDCDYKVFIIDECHSISNAGWQAFLKLIEEPPINTVFIFCTTEVNKIPNTILSRVQRFDFKRIPFDQIVSRLKYILEQEGITGYEEDAVAYIAKGAAGGMRDAITALDKCLAYDEHLTLDSVIKALGSVDYKVYFNLTNAIIDYKELEVIDIIEKCYREGSDIKLFVKNYTAFLLDVCKYCICSNFEYVQIPQTYKSDMDYLAPEKDFLKLLLSEINTLNSDIKWEASPKSIVELKLLALTQPENVK